MELARCAAVGHVDIDIHEVERYEEYVSIDVVVSGENAGSIDDFCESLLKRIATEDLADSHVAYIGDLYVKRVEDWEYSQPKAA
jgi:hypothetical protein